MLNKKKAGAVVRHPVEDYVSEDMSLEIVGGSPSERPPPTGPDTESGAVRSRMGPLYIEEEKSEGPPSAGRQPREFIMRKPAQQAIAEREEQMKAEQAFEERFKAATTDFYLTRQRKNEERRRAFEMFCRRGFEQWFMANADYVPDDVGDEILYTDMKRIWKETEIKKLRLRHQALKPITSMFEYKLRSEEMVYGERLPPEPAWLRNLPAYTPDNDILLEVFSRFDRTEKHFPDPNPPRQNNLLSQQVLTPVQRLRAIHRQLAAQGSEPKQLSRHNKRKLQLGVSVNVAISEFLVEGCGSTFNKFCNRWNVALKHEDVLATIRQIPHRAISRTLE